VTVIPSPCWICGDPADSREHKFKQSDVAQSSKSWAPGDQPHYVDDQGWRCIQGPGSELVKFEKVLCHACNTTRTQPFDRAYERFAEWINKKGQSPMAETRIDFAEVYGADFQTETANLVRYFAKHLGCRIASENYTMPPGLVASLTAADARPFEVTLALPRLGHLHAKGWCSARCAVAVERGGCRRRRRAQTEFPHRGQILSSTPWMDA